MSNPHRGLPNPIQTEQNNHILRNIITVPWEQEENEYYGANEDIFFERSFELIPPPSPRKKKTTSQQLINTWSADTGSLHI